MTQSKLSKSVRIFIRREKARLRSQGASQEELEAAIQALYQRFSLRRSGKKQFTPESKTGSSSRLSSNQ